LDAILLFDCYIYSFDIKDFSLNPVVNIEIRVFHGFAKGGDLFFDCFGGSFRVLGVAENHLGLLAVDIDSQVELLVFVKHLQEHLIVLDAGALGVHVLRNLPLHSFEERQHLFGEVLELLALLVKSVFLNWIVKMVFDIQAFSKSVYDFIACNLMNLTQKFVDVTSWSRKDKEFF
jgi:hypothetical protein